jgi:hypothetical protein
MRRSVAVWLVLLPSFLGWAAVRPPALADTAPDATRGEDPPPAPRALRINEIDYDQPGVDTAEFVEIVNTGDRRLRLRGTVLVLVNGTGETEYRRVRLSGRLGPSRRLVVAAPNVTVAEPSRELALPLPRDNVQNGSPDAAALVHLPRGRVLDAVSYEGAIDAATIDGLPGTWNLVRGDPVTEIDTNDETGSLCRLPHATDTGDDDRDWALCTPTPGAANAGDA